MLLTRNLSEAASLETEDTVVLTTPLGEKLTFELLDVIEYMGKDYPVLLSQDEDDDEVLILRTESSNDTMEIFAEIENEAEIAQVYQLFKEKNKDVLNFTDDAPQSPAPQGKRKCRSRLALVLLAGCLGWWGTHVRWLGYKEEAKEFKSVAGGLFGVFNLASWGLVFGDYIACIFGKYREDAYGNPVRYFALLRNLLGKKK